MPNRTLHRGNILHFLHDPSTHGEQAYEYIPDGAMLVQDGRIAQVGTAEVLQRDLNDVAVIDHGDALILPGFVDTHIHFPQTEIIASYGEALLDWLELYAFPAEMKFANAAYCSEVAERFLDELLANGTTTALVFGTVHAHSADILFNAAYQRQMRIACGKVLMDRNAPLALLDTAQSGYDESRALIEKWHKRGRLSYAVTPRFAITSSDNQLALAGKLLREYPDLLMHTHLSENHAELDEVKHLFPTHKNYLDVYDQHGLVCDHSVFAHSIHLCDSEWERLAECQSSISFCPTSNFMLGSGLFNAKRAQKEGVCVSLGTDVGGGSSFSMFRVIDEAYKCARLRGDVSSPLSLWFWATLGGARALNLSHQIGNFASGKEADFVVLDTAPLDLLHYRMAQVKSLDEKLLLLATLGDDRLVSKTYVLGEPAVIRRKV